MTNEKLKRLEAIENKEHGHSRTYNASEDIDWLLTELREAWQLNAAFKEWIKASEETREELAEKTEALKPFAETAEWTNGDSEAWPHDSRACGIGCDMGHAGYSSKGEWFHDDECPIEKAREVLAKFNKSS